MAERTLQGALTFLGFAIGILAVFYFAIEYVPRVSDWTRLGALILLGLFFAFLGVYLRSTVVGQPFFEGPRLSWLRPPVVMYLLALLAGVVAAMLFIFDIDDVPRPLRILVALAVAIGIIVGVARRRPRERLPLVIAPPAPSPKPARARPRKRPAPTRLRR